MGVMHDGEYRIMAEVEAEHWWYRGLRDLIARLLAVHGYTARSELRVLDAGCGTGENLRMLGGLLQTAYLGGFDPSPTALDYARGKAPGADVYPSDVCDPVFHADRYDLVISCDVLYLTGFDAAREGMRQIVERMEPGGLVMINLPAYQWLFSRHDVAVGTRQRFTARQVGRFLESVGLKVDLLTYRLCALFPAVVLARLPSMLIAPRAGEVRSDLASTNPWTGRCLTRILSWENRLILRGVRFPWGSSVFAVARRIGPSD
ncbi:MAG: class I SAM-dependent methyltransferase [Planctomycetaceae bacterium]|nr:class I SAM-dependent methyltransferase [Planctomycetaceae bacterium]